MKYIDREGNISIEDSGQDKLLAKVYSCKLGRKFIKLLIKPWVSKAGGWILEMGWSKLLIAPFIAHTGIDMTCYERREYASYNDFFTRQIKPEYRPLADDTQALISPCDGKLSVYPIHSTEDEQSRFFIKNTEYTVASLLRSEWLAKKYEGGTVCVFRLTVDDYHRYCYVDEGEKSKNFHISGVFHTVNPAANDVVPIYKENTREFSLLKSGRFGTVLMMEVGALMVGRITNYHQACHVKRGEEKGRFEFGGSTVILLLQKNMVQIDGCLLDNTRNGYETVVKQGEQIGIAVNHETKTG